MTVAMRPGLTIIAMRLVIFLNWLREVSALVVASLHRPHLMLGDQA